MMAALSLTSSSTYIQDDYIPDISDLNLGNKIAFKLNRIQLNQEYLAKRAISKPYTYHDEYYSRAAGSPSAVDNIVSYTESSVSVPLSSIPKEYGYTATFSIGTFNYSNGPKDYNSHADCGYGQLFNLLVDTGSDMAVVISGLSTDPESIQVQHRYNCSSSSTCMPTQNKLNGNTRWEQRYSDGTIANGTLVQDTLRFVSSISNVSDKEEEGKRMVSLEIKNQSILVVDQPGLRLTKSYGPSVDGIIGLNIHSPVISSTITENIRKQGHSSHQPFENQISDTHNQVNLMSLWLTKSLEFGHGGELLLNAIDRSRFQSPIRWSNRGPSPYDWSIPIDQGILLHDPVARKTTSVPNTDYTFAVLDSGSDGIYVQRQVYDSLFQRVPGSKQLPNGYWRVPCIGDIELVIGINDMLYKIPYEEWVKSPSETVSNESSEPGMCQARVFGSSPGPTLLGTVFLRNVYTVFDFSRAGYERIGIAVPRAHSGNS
ncbi:hypothetical protein BGZ76_001287 [Entomortierella beljakovae]|nr:hypothetical protein BGZ76_001287 [Entomortierella beljakovae]